MLVNATLPWIGEPSDPVTPATIAPTSIERPTVKEPGSFKDTVGVPARTSIPSDAKDASAFALPPAPAEGLYVAVIVMPFVVNPGVQA